MEFWIVTNKLKKVEDVISSAASTQNFYFFIDVIWNRHLFHTDILLKGIRYCKKFMSIEKKIVILMLIHF